MGILLSDVLKNLEQDTELEKDAEFDLFEQADAEGRAMAQGFMDKIAVDTDPIQVTPDHGQTPGNVNPKVQLSTAGGAAGGAASAVISKLVSRTARNGGVIQTPAGTVGAADTSDGDTLPAADAVIARVVASQQAATKTSAEYILEQLYLRHIA
jgi:hypothetical protein